MTWKHLVSSCIALDDFLFLISHTSCFILLYERNSKMNNYEFDYDTFLDGLNNVDTLSNNIV